LFFVSILEFYQLSDLTPPSPRAPQNLLTVRVWPHPFLRNFSQRNLKKIISNFMLFQLFFLEWSCQCPQSAFENSCLISNPVSVYKTMVFNSNAVEISQTFTLCYILFFLLGSRVVSDFTHQARKLSGKATHISIVHRTSISILTLQIKIGWI
jgi:hypothetical protein